MQAAVKARSTRPQYLKPSKREHVHVGQGLWVVVHYFAGEYEAQGYTGKTPSTLTKVSDVKATDGNRDKAIAKVATQLWQRRLSGRLSPAA